MLLLVVLMPVALATQTNIALTYDANGNLLTNGDKRYVYDGFNRLAEVFINNTIKEKYWYDPDGNRLLKVEFHSDGSNTTTFYIDNSFVRIMNASGTYDEVYYYDEYDLIAKEDAEGKKFYHPDHLGSTTLVTNEAGEVVEETVYDPYGAVQEGGNERHDYEGKETDFSGLQYFGARYYDPGKPKRWTQPDSLLPDVYDPQQLNRYSFERNNPYKHEDEKGNDIKEFFFNSPQTVYVFQRGLDLTGNYFDMGGIAMNEGLYSNAFSYYGKGISTGGMTIWGSLNIFLGGTDISDQAKRMGAIDLIKLPMSVPDYATEYSIINSYFDDLKKEQQKEEEKLKELIEENNPHSEAIPAPNPVQTYCGQCGGGGKQNSGKYGNYKSSYYAQKAEELDNWWNSNKDKLKK